MTTYLIAIAIIFAVVAGWVGVQHLVRRFAVRHPEFGPPREEGGGCGAGCSCGRQERDACQRQRESEI